MKIAQVASRYLPDMGGMETHISEISEHLSALNHEVTVLTMDSSSHLPEEEVINGVLIKRFKAVDLAGFRFSKRLTKYLSENSGNFDVVHAHGLIPALYACKSNKAKNLFLTLHYHGSGISKFNSTLYLPYKILGRRAFKKANKVISVSKYEQKLVLQDFKLDSSKSVVIPNGVNLCNQHPTKPRDDLKRILCVCRLEQYKGIQHIIEILPELKENVVLVVVGKGPYKDVLVKLASKKGVVGRVSFFENLSQSELYNQYAQASLFALLSTREAYGICVAEALSFRVPCLLSNESALSDWVDNKVCFGVDFPVDYEKLSLQINDVLNGNFNPSAFSDHFVLTWADVAAKLDVLYNDSKDIIGSRKALSAC